MHVAHEFFLYFKYCIDVVTHIYERNILIIIILFRKCVFYLFHTSWATNFSTHRRIEPHTPKCRSVLSACYASSCAAQFHALFVWTNLHVWSWKRITSSSTRNPSCEPVIVVYPCSTDRCTTNARVNQTRIYLYLHLHRWRQLQEDIAPTSSACQPSHTYLKDDSWTCLVSSGIITTIPASAEIKLVKCATYINLMPPWQWLWPLRSIQQKLSLFIYTRNQK